MSHWKSFIFPIALGLIGALLNSIHIPFFYGSFIVLGSFVAFLSVMYRGYLAGAITSLICSLPLVLFWEQAWPFPVYLLETLLVGYLWNRISRNLMIAVFIFWLTIGLPLMLAYQYFEHQLYDSLQLVFVCELLINSFIYAQIAMILSFFSKLTSLLQSDDYIFQSNSIKKKYAQQTSLIFVTAGFIIAILVLLNRTSDIHKDNDSQIERLHEKVLFELNSVIKSNITLIEEFANAISLVWGDYKKRELYLEKAHKRSSQFSTMTVINNEGMIENFSMSGMKSHPVMDSKIYVDDSDYFINTINSKVPFVDDGLQGITNESDMIIGISTGVSLNGNQNVGIIQGSILLSKMENLRKILNKSKDYQVLILNKNNQSLFSSEALNLKSFQDNPARKIIHPISKESGLNFSGYQDQNNKIFKYRESETDWGWSLMTLQEDQYWVIDYKKLLITFVLVLLAMTLLSELAATIMAGFWGRHMARLTEAVTLTSKNQDTFVNPEDIHDLPKELKVVYQAIVESKIQVEETSNNLSLLVKSKTQELQKANDTLQAYAETDYLTQLYNRRIFNQKLNEIWKIRRDNKQNLSTILIDIDHFKKVNDQWGHPAGDSVLKHFSRYLLQFKNLRTHCISRIGGEEFAIISLEYSHSETLVLAEKIHKGVSNLKIQVDDKNMKTNISIKVSIGVATINAGKDDVEKLYKLTDQALYKAKHSGRNQIQSIDIS